MNNILKTDNIKKQLGLKKANLANFILLLFAMLFFHFGMQAQPTSQDYTSPNTYTYTVPAGYTADIIVSAWGGGAGGGNGMNAQGGGGGGGYSTNVYLNVPAGDYTIVVGAGGSPGVNGGTSSYNFNGTPVTTTGGSTADSNGNGGAGGVGNSTTGGAGGNRQSTQTAGGGGGGSGTAPTAGSVGSGGTGGAGGFSSGMLPSGGNGGNTSGAGSNGSSGVDFGGGGGGKGDSGGTSGSGASGRVNVSVTNVTVLPIELISFTSNLDGRNVILNWSTATELNNEVFVIECSNDGSVFKNIGEVQGHGTTTIQQDYQFTDKNPVAGINYYRLKQIDTDGTFSYSSVITVDIARNNSSTIVTNPVSNELIIELIELSSDNQRIQIFNANGSLVLEVKAQNDASKINIPVDDFEPGNYYVKISDRSNAVTHKWVKL